MGGKGDSRTGHIYSHTMSLNSFFDTLDTDAQFEAWKTTTIQKLLNLRNMVPIDNRIEMRYIGETIELIEGLSLNNNPESQPDNGNKHNLSLRLSTCNLYYKEFGIR